MTRFLFVLFAGLLSIVSSLQYAKYHEGAFLRADGTKCCPETCNMNHCNEHEAAANMNVQEEDAASAAAAAAGDMLAKDGSAVAASTEAPPEWAKNADGEGGDDGINR